MEKRRIYHGSLQIVKEPEIRITKFHKDFYYGFYCTLYKEQAKRWATRFGNDGYISVYEYSENPGLRNEVNARRGTEIEIEFDKTFRIEIGNAVAVSMEYNGQEYSNFGNRNVVRILNYEAQDGKLELVGR